MRAAHALLGIASIIRPYMPPAIPEPRIVNKPHAGKLYLTLKDAIAMALENNLDLQAERYGPLLAEWSLKRAEAGGPIRGVPNASAQVSSVNNGVGVNGSTASAGLGGGGGNGG